MSDNIKVVVKVRPLITREIEDKLYRQWRVVNNTLQQIDQNGKDVFNLFTFDKVYDENTRTTDVYDDIAKPIVEAAAAGFNGTIFAYGQTSSGKTYTMTGTDEAPGIIPLSVMNLFDIIKNISDRDFLVRVSYVEIYNETLIDLLNTEKKNIKIQDTLQGVKVDATVRVATSPEEVLQFMNEGQANRQTGSTNMNVESSRSHTIFQITIESREQTEGEEVGCLNVSQLNLVDLAGSERSGQTGATGMRFKEGTHINKSLTFLGLVIKQLSEGQSKHVNYRDSKLTRILQNSLGGNAKTSIICAVTPAAVEETISTLQFASRAKAIKNSPEVNVVATDNKMIDSLTKQLSSLKTQLESKRNVEEDNQKLQKQIAVLQRFLSGFGQRSTTNIMIGSRRKLQQIRRATISTPHIQEEDTTPSVPRFCTPSLKYNPALISNPTEFQPVHSMTNLASVPEEPPRLITPPPRIQRTTTNEIIEIDSDDEMTPDIQSCSPHHKCFHASKTPPCVLRKAALEADKNFKDLLELTQREKMFKPNELDLIEKLKNSTSVIAELEENIGKLSQISIENESEIKNLKEKISITEEEVRSVTSAKLELEARCTEYYTKLTDSEIMYETLKKKAKSREEELLLRLEEVSSVKKMNDAKVMPSIGSTCNNASPNIEELVQDLKKQLSDRNKFISELETNLSMQNEKVVSLERQTQDIQTALDTCKEQLSKSEEENTLQKSTIKTLNTLIEDQKSNLEIATNDLQLYNNTIEKLQDELRRKEKLYKVSLNDDEIEQLIINEEKIIANNENISNIIQSLKVALESKNKEIQTLSLAQNNEAVNKENEIVLKNKEIQITQLQEKVTVLQQQLEQNPLDMTNLLQEKSCLLTSLEEVNKELLELQENNKVLCNDIKNYESKLSNLNELNEELKNEKQHIEKHLTGMNMELTSQVENYLNKINLLENDLQNKNVQIDKLVENTNESRYVSKITEIIKKLQDIVTVLGGESKTIFDPSVTIDITLNDLENVVMEVDSNINLFKTNLLLGRQIISEMISLEHKFNILENAVSSGLNDDTKFCEIYESLTKEHEELFKNECTENINDSELEFTPLLTWTNSFCETMKQKIKCTKLACISSVDKLIKKIETKNSEMSQLNEELYNMKTDLEYRSQAHISTLEEHNKGIMEKNKTINNICYKIVEIGHRLHISNDFMADIGNISDEKIYTCSQILPILDKMASHYLLIVEQLEECSKQKDILSEAQNKVQNLTGENIDIIEYITKVTRSNSDISTELKDIREHNENLKDDLKTSNEVLQNLKEDLKAKSEELDVMEGHIHKWKEQFNELDLIMKKQLDELQAENLELKKKKLDSSIESEDNGAVCNNIVIKEIQAANKFSAKPASDVPINPPSLLTISCNKIVEIIQDVENNASSVTLSTSKSDVDTVNFETSNPTCYECDRLKDDLKTVNHKHSELTKLNNELKMTNASLIKEIHDAYEEIKELLNCTNELQKKMFNHRTNLSTLTATTYAENKSLSSQVKFLQLHHTRFHTVCQRDLPQLKEQLHELMTLLKEENLESKLNASFKRYSLPVPLDSNSILYSFKNESTLDGDILMLDTNITVNTTADNTLTGLDQTCCEVAQACSYNDVASQTVSSLTNETSHKICKDQNIMLQKEIENLNKLLKMMQSDGKDVVKVHVETSPIKNISNLETHGKALCEICETEKEKNIQLVQEVGKLKEEVLEVCTQKDDLDKKYNELSLEVLVCKICQEETEKRLKLLQEVENLKESIIQVNNQKDDFEKKYNDLSVEMLTRNTSDNEKERHKNFTQEVEKLKEDLLHVTNEKLDFEKKYNDLSVEMLTRNTSENEKKQVKILTQEVKKLKEDLLHVTNEKLDFEKKCNDLSVEMLTRNTSENEKEQVKILTQELEKLKEDLLHVRNEKLDFEKKYNDLSVEMLTRNIFENEKEQIKNLTQEVEKLKEHLLQVTNEKLDFEKKYNDLSVKMLTRNTSENEKEQVKNLTQEVEKLKEDLLHVTNEKLDFEKKCNDLSVEMLTRNTSENEKEQVKILTQEIEKLKEDLLHVTNEKLHFEKKYNDLSVEMLTRNISENEKEQIENLTQEVEKLKEDLLHVTNEKLDFEKKYNELNLKCLVCNMCDNEKEKCLNLAQEVDKLKENLLQVTNEKVNFENKCKDLSVKSLVCSMCDKEKEKCINLAQEVEKLKENLLKVTNEKVGFEKKYNELSLEVPSTEALLRKLHNFEKELENKSKEIEKLSTALKSTKDLLNGVQEENDNLSTQVMELISEIDDLKKEIETEKARNSQNIPISNSISADSGVANINEDISPKVCPECIQKDEHIKALQSKNSNNHTRLSRSYSDSDSSSRYNKICTLQNELEAGREDCNELKEEVTTIKNQLEINNLSIGEAMDLDESINDTAVESAPNKPIMPQITEENISDIYNSDKLDCLNYYMEKIGEKVSYDRDVKIIDVMKTLYCKLMTGHETQIEVMLNKLREYEHYKRETEEKIIILAKSLEERDCFVKNIEKKLSVLRNNIGILGESRFGVEGMEMFKENVLFVLDTEFSMNSKSSFETVLEQFVMNNNELNELKNKNVQLEESSQTLKKEFESLTKEIIQLKSRLSDKENEFKLLAAQKEKIHEINSALTVDIVKKEEEFVEMVSEIYRKLAENNILITDDIDNTLSPVKKLHLLVHRMMAQNNSNILSEKNKEINDLKQDIANYQTILEEKTKELSVFTDLLERTKELNNGELKNKQDEIQKQKSLYDDLNEIYNAKVEENNVNRALVHKMTEEITILKENISSKDTMINNLQMELTKFRHTSVESESKIPELLQKITDASQELDKLKLINQTLTEEKHAMAVEFEKLGKIIEQNKIDNNKMESDILVLKESVRENDNIVDGLKREIAELIQQNLQLKEDVEEKGKELSRLQFNMKTHETTARIQTKMISRLQKQREDDVTAMNEKDKQLTELNLKCEIYQKESIQMNDCIASLKQEIELLKQLKESLEEKVAHLESCHDDKRKSRSSTGSVTDTSRRRRQSIHDSSRMIHNNTEDDNKVEPVPNGNLKPNELMDVDEDSSYRSTPVRLSKGRDSLPSKHEESEEDNGSRSSSAMAARRRRRSTHDLLRPNLKTPDGHDISRGRLRDESKHSPQSDGNTNSTVVELQNRLTACQQELEELRESYKELDEECDTCAEYLRERDEQCARLKKEKAALEKVITDLNGKLQNNQNQSSSKATFAEASVNTDEDWTNLHSIVVDRMSFDAEVEKNKKLRRAIEELRYNKQELKIAVTKMQKALEEKTSKDTEELKRTRIEFKSCKEELEDLKRRYQELDEECETCAEYLRERDDQCRRLKEKVAESEKMITKLNEQLQNNHNQNSSKATHVDTAVNTDEDGANLRLVQVEVEKNKRLTTAVEELRLNNKELKITVTKMQKVLEEKTSKDAKELQRTRIELESCKEELEDLKKRYQELDEECETCAQYLRERDDQCRRLKETAAALEAKVQELQESAGHVSLSARKKRQSLHDFNRHPVPDQVDASTEITEDFPSRQLADERKLVADDTKLIKKLKDAVKELSEQKTSLEQQLMAVPTAPVYVATGSAIVQNQQITDVLNENQKLKKMNAKLISLCTKRGKAMVKSNRENQDPTEEI